jgi:hypothetical protein
MERPCTGGEDVGSGEPSNGQLAITRLVGSTSRASKLGRAIARQRKEGRGYA